MSLHETGSDNTAARLSPSSLAPPRKKLLCCPVCDREFRRPEHLRRHKRIHTHEKPFACSCGQSFSRQDLLRRHEKKEQHGAHHKEPRQREYPDHGNHLFASEPVPSFPLYSVPEPALNGVASGGWCATESDWTRDNPALFDASWMLPSDLDLSGFLLLDGLDLDYERLHSTAVQQSLVEPAAHCPQDLGSSFTIADGHEAGNSGAISRYGSPLPTLPTEPLQDVNHDVARVNQKRQGKLTELEYRHILKQTNMLEGVIPAAFRLPSRQALSRFLRGYLKGLNEHFPVVHTPTLSIVRTEVSKLLSMATIGAHWCFEAGRSEKLFFAAKAIILHKLAARADALQNRAESTAQDVASLLDLLHALLNLIVTGTWGSARLLREALSLQSTTATLARELGLRERAAPDDDSTEGTQSIPDKWASWVRDEGRRRLLFMAYCYSNVTSLAYDIPPFLLSSEIQLRMPSHPSLWAAETAHEWNAIQETTTYSRPYLQDCMAPLLGSVDPTQQDDVFTPLDNYISILALLQRIFFLRQASGVGWPNQDAEIQEPSGSSMRAALQRWQSRWEHSPDSSVEFPTWTGPIPSTSTAFLRLAWIRLSTDLGAYRNLTSRDPALIAHAIFKAPTVRRSSTLTMPVLQAIYALAVPVQTGIEFVARAQAVSWSVQHSMCNLESAIFLSKWLEDLAETMSIQPLSTDEHKLLALIRSMVHETSLFDEDELFEQLLTAPAVISSESIRLLATVIARVWAKIYQGPFAFPFVDIVGASLEIYARLVETHLSHTPTSAT